MLTLLYRVIILEDKTVKTKKKAVDRILDAAGKLFYKEGIHAVRIEEIIKEANVAMNTMYRHFSSKEELVEAYLRKRDITWRNWFKGNIDEKKSAVENINRLFDALDEWFNEDGFRGCAFINAAGEFGDDKPKIQEINKFHKEMLYKDILELFIKEKYNNPEKIAKQIVTLIEGSIVRAYINEDLDSAKIAKETANIILNSYK